MRPTRARTSLVCDERAVSAVEFAMIMPVVIALFFGGFVLTQAVALSRKVTITTRALADLVSQYATMSASDMATVQNAATQIIAPFDATPLGTRLSEITVTSIAGITVSQVVWSTATNAKPYQKSITIQLPTGMPNSLGLTYILSETFYSYTPPIGTSIIGSINLGDRIFMVPRVSSTVTYTGS